MPEEITEPVTEDKVPFGFNPRTKADKSEIAKDHRAGTVSGWTRSLSRSDAGWA